VIVAFDVRERPDQQAARDRGTHKADSTDRGPALVHAREMMGR